MIDLQSSGAPCCTPTETDAGFYVDIAWSSTITDPIPGGSAWGRGINLVMGWAGGAGDDANLTITGGPTGVISATGTVNTQAVVFESSAQNLNSATGSLVIDTSEFNAEIGSGAEGFITTGGAAVDRALRPRRSCPPPFLSLCSLCPLW